MQVRRWVLPCIILLVFALVFSLWHRINKEVDSNTAFRTDVEPITERFPNIGHIEKCLWKADILSKERTIGPTSYAMKGFILLSPQKIQEIKEKYFWQPSKPEIDVNFFEGDFKVTNAEWYFSNEYNNFVKSANYIGRFYFDMNDGLIYFDIQK